MVPLARTFSILKEHEAIGESLGLVHVVRREDDRHAVGAQLRDEFPHRHARLRIKPGGGLVEKHHLRSVHDGARDHQASLESRRRAGRVSCPQIP